MSRSPRAEPSGSAVPLAVRLGRAQIILWLVAGILISLNFVAGVTGGLELLPYTITRFFDGNDTGSFLAGAKNTLLLLATVLMYACSVAAARRADPAAAGWRALAAVTCFVLADETTMLHSTLSEVLRDRYHFTGALRYTWAVLYLPVAAVVGWALVRRLRGTSGAVLGRLLPGIALYAVGAIVLEPFRSKLEKEHGDESLSFRTMASVADSIVLVGLVLVVCAALVAASRLATGFTVRLVAEPVRDSLAGPAVAPDRPAPAAAAPPTVERRESRSAAAGLRRAVGAAPRDSRR
jgi:hypothetical protein